MCAQGEIIPPSPPQNPHRLSLGCTLFFTTNEKLLIYCMCVCVSCLLFPACVLHPACVLSFVSNLKVPDTTHVMGSPFPVLAGWW